MNDDQHTLALMAFANTECVRRELDRIGDAVNCWRLRNETDRAFAYRLALHIQESIIDREQLLTLVFSLTGSVTGRTAQSP